MKWEDIVCVMCVMMKKLCTPEGEYITDVPEMIDICPDCFKKFCNWIKIVKEETK